MRTAKIGPDLRLPMAVPYRLSNNQRAMLNLPLYTVPKAGRG